MNSGNAHGAFAFFQFYHSVKLVTMILVTGINGFVGKHLARELYKRKIKIFGVGRREATADIKIKGLLEGYIQCDVANEIDVEQKLPLENIDCVINLAGLADVGASFNNPGLYMDVNVKVLSGIGNILLKKNSSARIIAVSTGAVYDTNQSMPLTESSETIKKGSPYALSKLAMEKAAQDLRSRGLDCVVVRPFNHIGPEQGLGFLIPDLAKKLIEADKSNLSVTAGNLKTIRDYTDVRDIARAYCDLALSKNLHHDLYNVCSGNGKSGEEIVEYLCKALNIEFKKLNINTDPSLIRPSDPPIIYGDNSRIKSDTSWLPKTTLEETIEDIVSEL